MQLKMFEAEGFPSPEQIKKNLNRFVKQALPQEVELAATWYNEARLVAVEIATNLGVDLERGAAVLSAFSPRKTWSINVAHAIEYSLTLEAKGTKQIIKKVLEVTEKGLDALNGLKTKNFALAICGDVEAIVLDTWMLKAAGCGRKTLTPKQYKIISEVVKELAEEHNLAPVTTQALIWIKARRRVF